MKTMIPLILLIVALAILAFAIVQFFKQNKFVNQAQTADATFIGYEYTKSTEYDTIKGVNKVASTFPKFEFTSTTGQVVQFVSTTSVANPSQGVKVLYMIEDPKNAQISSFMAIYGWVLLIAILGGVLLLSAAVLRVII